MHRVLLWMPPTGSSHNGVVGYEVTIGDGDSELVVGADTYQLEGPLTTFFSTDSGRRVVDSWSVRLASFRTADVVRIRRIDDLQVA
jgi:hypothetical protein